MTAQIWRCRVRYADGTEGLIEEIRPMPVKVQEDYYDTQKTC